MIQGTIKGQTLYAYADKMVSGTIDYLTAEFKFSKDWNGLSKWAHFTQGETTYDVFLVDDKIPEQAHLNLSEGEWQMYLHGVKYEPEEQIAQRITTNIVVVHVESSGVLEGEPLGELPLSVAEMLDARISLLEEHSDYSVYDGDYEVTPSLTEDTILETAEKTMAKDVTIKKVPRYDVANTAGGITIYIGIGGMDNDSESE